MEVVEHVADVEFFLTTCASMVRPGGLMFVATINRTMKAAALAIFAAENVLRWLPRGTHQYEKLVRPDEIEKPLIANGMNVTDRTGVFFNPLLNQWNLSQGHGRELHDGGQAGGLTGLREIRAFGRYQFTSSGSVGSGGDLDALFDQRARFSRRRLADDAAGIGLAVVDLAGLFGKFRRRHPRHSP